MVDSEQTGKQLLEKGELKRRVTIIPLNKIASKSLNDDVVKKAKKLVSLHLTLKLIAVRRAQSYAMKIILLAKFCIFMSIVYKCICFLFEYAVTILEKVAFKQNISSRREF